MDIERILRKGAKNAKDAKDAAYCERTASAFVLLLDMKTRKGEKVDTRSLKTTRKPSFFPLCPL
jgi:hypothetical protein